MGSSQYKSWSPRPNRWLVESAIPSPFDFRTRTASKFLGLTSAKPRSGLCPFFSVTTETRQGSSINACGALDVKSSRVLYFSLDIRPAVIDGSPVIQAQPPTTPSHTNILVKQLSKSRETKSRLRLQPTRSRLGLH